MRRASITTALTLAGVLAAGTATAYVNAQVLHGTSTDATGTNAVGLPAPSTTDVPAAPVPVTTIVTTTTSVPSAIPSPSVEFVVDAADGASADTDGSGARSSVVDGSGAADPSSAVTDLDVSVPVDQLAGSTSAATPDDPAARALPGSSPPVTAAAATATAPATTGTAPASGRPTTTQPAPTLTTAPTSEDDGGRNPGGDNAGSEGGRGSGRDGGGGSGRPGWSDDD